MIHMIYKRLYLYSQVLHEKVHDQVVERLVKAYKQLRIGDPLEGKESTPTPKAKFYCFIFLMLKFKSRSLLMICQIYFGLCIVFKSQDFYQNDIFIWLLLD